MTAAARSIRRSRRRWTSSSRSNLERLLYLLCGDCEEVAGYMRALRDDGCYTVSPALLGKLRAEFACGCCSDEETKQTIGRVWREEGYLMDTHTAVAWHVAEQYQSDAPVVVLSTASAYKFPAAVLSAVGGDASGDEFDVMERLHALTGVPVPKALAELRTKPVRHHAVIDREEMPAFVNAHLEGIKFDEILQILRGRNDFVLLENFDGALKPAQLPELARRLCDRHFGVGADGLMVVEPPRAGGDCSLRFLNADGSLAGCAATGRAASAATASTEASPATRRGSRRTPAWSSAAASRPTATACA